MGTEPQNPGTGIVEFAVGLQCWIIFFCFCWCNYVSSRFICALDVGGWKHFVGFIWPVSSFNILILSYWYCSKVGCWNLETIMCKTFWHPIFCVIMFLYIGCLAQGGWGNRKNKKK